MSNINYTPLTTQSYFSDEHRRKDGSFGAGDYFGVCIVHVIWMFTLPLHWCCSFKVLKQFERIVVSRLGRMLPLKGPGLVYVIPFVDQWKKIDMRMRAFNVPPMEMVTLDRCVMKVGATVQYRITDPVASLTEVKDLDRALRDSGHAALSAQVGMRKLNETRADKLAVQDCMMKQANLAMKPWGIEIARFELTQIVALTSEDSDEQKQGIPAIMNLFNEITASHTTIAMPENHPPSTPQNSAALTNKLLGARELFAIAKGHLDDQLCQQTRAIFIFEVVSTNGLVLTWTLDLKNAPGCIREGDSILSADVKFELKESTLQSLFSGMTSPAHAYANGDLVISGSVQTALKLELLVRKMKAG